MNADEYVCTSCRTVGEHTREECLARRPICGVIDCERVTCIQAMTQQGIPVCLDHFFEWHSVLSILNRALRELHDPTPRNAWEWLVRGLDPPI